MNLEFRVIEVTDKMEPQGYLRAVTYRIMDGDDPLDDGQWRWAAQTKDELPAYAVGDEFALAPKQEYGAIGIVNRYPTLQVGQLWWLSSRLELVEIKDVCAFYTRAMVLSQVDGARSRMGDAVLLDTHRADNAGGRIIGPEYGPIPIAWGDRKVAS